VEDFENNIEYEAFDDEDFSEIDALIECLNALPRNEMSVLSYHKVQQMRFSCAMIKKILRETDCNARIECRHHELDPNIGVIRVEAASLNILDIEGFSRAAEFASNLEIYPLKENKVRMTLTFHGLLTPI